MDPRPLLLVYANCQGDEMHAMASRLEPLMAQYEVERVFLGDLSGFVARHGMTLARERLGRVRLVWEQSSQASPEERGAVRELVPRAARWLRFPALTCSALYPFSLSDTRPGGNALFPYSDMLAARLWRELGGADGGLSAVSDDEILDRYMTLSARMMPDLDRLLERDMLQWRQRDQDSDIAMTPFLSERLRAQQLFYTTGRGSWIPTADMLRRLVAESCDDPGVRQDAVIGSDRLSRNYVGNDGLSVPVHPLVAERLGLSWYEPDSLHAWGSFRFDFRDWIIRCTRLSDCL